MALCSLRFRRALTLSSSLINHHRPFSSIPAITASFSLSSLLLNSQNHGLDPSLPRLLGLPFQSRPFRSSTVSLGPPRSSFNSDNSEIGPDTILFEGCDFNHWLITMEFPNDPKPTPEEMVETYVQTLAKVVGSVEEAKKRMYACSTTTYIGFQAEMSEEMSEKFRDLPGVVFILPDSYIDPVNKEYGGDKYINGTIIPRPPPVQFGRQGGRYGDRNRDYNRRSRGPAPHQEGNSAYDRPTYGAQQNFTPQQNYGPAGPGERRGPMPPNNAPVGGDTYQGDRRDPVPSYQANYNQGGQGNYSPQGQRDFPPGNQRDYVPPEQRDFQGDYRNYAPSQGGNIGQGASGTHVQGASGAYVQGPGGTNGQGVGGSHGQMGAGYGQSYPRQGGDQRFSQLEQRNNMQGEQGNYAATGHTGTDQGKY